MALVLVRIDYRLIHGQILEAWVPITQSDCLIVANDEAAANHIQRMVMKTVVPQDIEVAFLPIQDAIRDLTDSRWAHKRVLLILANCADALKLFQAGCKFKRLNVGNLHFSPHKKQVTNSVALDSGDVAVLSELNKQGVIIEVRSTPKEASLSFSEIIRLYPDL